MLQVVVVAIVHDDEFFRTGVGVVEALAELGGDDGIVRGDNDRKGATELFEPILGRVLVAQDPANGEKRVMVLGDIGEGVERSEE